MDSIRVPITTNLSPRSATSNKDEMPANIFYDASKTGATYAVKRPGFTLRTSFSTGSMGIYTYNSVLFIFTNSATAPTQEAV